MTAPAAMPSVEEIKDLLLRFHADTASAWRHERDGIATSAARAILDLFAPILAEKEREIVELKGHLAVRMDYLVGLATTADRHVEAAAEARALAAEAALAAIEEALEPFDDALGEDDDGYPDDTKLTLSWRAHTHYALTLADLRRVRKHAAAIRAQGE